MFNSEQRDHMRYLRSLPPKSKCWCGWYRVGECPHCPDGYTCQDKMATACGACDNTPIRPGKKLTHIIGCRFETKSSSGGE